MYSLVALVSCLAVASASICCIPAQWEGSVGFLTGIIHNGKVQISKGSALMAYDGVRRVIGQREYVEIGTTYGRQTQIDVLMDFNNDMKYIREGGKCIKTKLNRVWEDGCVPDNAIVVGTNNDLGFGNNSLDINSYKVSYGGAVEGYFSVTSSGCVPVLESWRGTLDGNTFMENTGYVNITAGLSDASVLNTPPMGCENAPMVEAHYTQGAFNTGMVGKRSLFGF